MRADRSVLGVLLLTFTVAACAYGTIEGTTIAATDENKEIYRLVQLVEQALEQQDGETLLSMVSPSYFEDMGTPAQADDYGFHELKERILATSMAAAKEMHVAFEVHDIVVQDEHAYADLRYHSRARVELPSGSVWDSHRDFNRIVFAREDGSWRIISGL